MSLFLYAISSAEQPAPVKIGRSVNVARRLCQLQTASPSPLRVWWSRETSDPDLEGKVHRHFADMRLSGEWFLFDNSDWAADIAEAADLLEGLPPGGRLPKPPRRRRRPTPVTTVSHGHLPPADVHEHSWEGAGTGERCTCGHSSTLHAGSAPYSCTSSDTGSGCYDPCECRAFHSSAQWSLEAWLARASDCPRCQAALRHDPNTVLQTAKDVRPPRGFYW
ncbi:GIY-YIG nuclease family protein [Streptomyces melanogenes]|uniref:GIY-YIG nuclease family protein n=1 Tax=Streptomyces melanogenes TaxID=67326 RepID=UPI0037AD3D1A